MNTFVDDLVLEKELERFSKASNIELEAKVRKNKGWSKKDIEKILSYLQEDNYEIKETFEIDYYIEGGKRITERNSEFFETSKTNKFTRIFENYTNSIKISLSEEVNKKTDFSPEEYNFKREKKRTSFVKDNLTIDITEVNEDDNIKYEVEIEVINFKEFSFSQFKKKVIFVYNLLVNYGESIILFFNKSMGSTKGGRYLDSSKISHARDLQIPDLTNNGLLDHYTISIKADGMLTFLIFHDEGIWLLRSNFIQRLSSLKPEFKDLENSIFVTELMSQDNMKESQALDSKYLLLVFDVLISKGVLVYDKNYLERRKFIVEKNTPLFQMKEKEILIYEKKNKDFHLRVKEAFEIERNSLYNTDGLIFTPIESPYITEGQKLVENQKFVRKNFKRNLGFYKDVCKYKRPEDLTIDFLVKNGKPYFNDKNSEKLFAGSFNYPFKYYNYEIPEGSEYEGKIVEFKPTFVDDNEINVIYKPFRIRQDKFVSNKLSTIINLWNLVHNPITPETLKGENITMMRKYNNKIKSKLIEGLSGYVLDIGGGNGGDLPKYKNNHKLDKILCVEPNKDFNKEFERRFDKLKLDKNNFKLLSTGGEDSIKITKCARKFFPISMENKDFNVVFMLSLSFFWKTKKFLQRLTNTINEIKSMYYERGGNKDFNVCFFTIIGDRVKNLFSLEGKEVKLNTILLRKISNEEYYIDITDSVTVFSQLEYFVNLQEIWNLINVKSLSEETPKPYFPSDYILSENEITYSKLFSYGMATLNKEITEVFTKPRLFVDDTKGTSTQYGPISKGDDKEEKLEKISNNCYRVATINQDHSLYHSILKLLDNSYRKSNVYERINKAVDLKEKLKGANNNLNIISRKLNKGIVVYNTAFQEQIYGKDMTKFIFLFKNLDDSFEPIICKESGQNKYIFNKNNLN